MNKFLASVLLLCLSLFVAAHSPNVADIRSFDGAYKLDDAQSDNIDNAIDQGVKGLNLIVRHFARNRLKQLNPAYHTVSFASSAKEISIVVDNQPALKMPADGEGAHLLQEFDSSDGHRVNDYTLSTEGRTLTMQVTETSSRLSAPIRYKQVYRRAT